MNLRYDPETDSLYVGFQRRLSVDTREITPNVRLLMDDKSRPVGLDIDRGPAARPTSSTAGRKARWAFSAPIKHLEGRLRPPLALGADPAGAKLEMEAPINRPCHPKRFYIARLDQDFL